MPLSSAISDADLHGLVDGQFDPEGRAAILRRVAASPRDRARVEAWQDQADAIRAAFAGVEHEPLPASLDLRAPAALVPPRRTPGVGAGAPPRRWSRSVATAASLAVMAAGLAASWLVAGLPAATGSDETSGTTDDERVVADRTLAALAFDEIGPTAPATTAERPALAAIPDLTHAGFTFTGAEARGVAPRAIVFRYRDMGGNRIAVGAVRARGDGVRGLARRDGGLTWRDGPLAYAIFGTVLTERLGVLAAAVDPGAAAARRSPEPR